MSRYNLYEKFEKLKSSQGAVPCQGKYDNRGIGEQYSPNEIIAQTQATISLVESCSLIPLLSYSPRCGTAPSPYVLSLPQA